MRICENLKDETVEGNKALDYHTVGEMLKPVHETNSVLLFNNAVIRTDVCLYLDSGADGRGVLPRQGLQQSTDVSSISIFFKKYSLFKKLVNMIFGTF